MTDDRVTRFEVIDHREHDGERGRVFSAWDCRIDLSYQDDGRTLKVFVTDRSEQTKSHAVEASITE